MLDAIGSEGDSSSDSLVVAEVSSEGAAQTLFRTVNQRLRDGALRFDAREWPGLVLDQFTGNQADGGS